MGLQETQPVSHWNKTLISSHVSSFQHKSKVPHQASRWLKPGTTQKLGSIGDHRWSYFWDQQDLGQWYLDGLARHVTCSKLWALEDDQIAPNLHHQVRLIVCSGIQSSTRNASAGLAGTWMAKSGCYDALRTNELVWSVAGFYGMLCVACCL